MCFCGGQGAAASAAPITGSSSSCDFDIQLCNMLCVKLSAVMETHCAPLVSQHMQGLGRLGGEHRAAAAAAAPASGCTDPALHQKGASQHVIGVRISKAIHATCGGALQVCSGWYSSLGGPTPIAKLHPRQAYWGACDGLPMPLLCDIAA